MGRQAFKEKGLGQIEKLGEDKVPSSVRRQGQRKGQLPDDAPHGERMGGREKVLHYFP